MLTHETHIRVREEMRRRMHQRYARGQQLPLEFRDTPGNTNLALAALLPLQQQSTDALHRYLNVAFHAYWNSAADLNELKTVNDLLHHLFCCFFFARKLWARRG